MSLVVRPAPAAQNTGPAWPVPGSDYVTSLTHYNQSSLHGTWNARNKFWAMDIGNCPVGTPIHAIMEGRVKAAAVSSGFGNYITLAHNDGSESLYGHLSKISVSLGQTVGRDAVIGLSGNTGTSTGPHLHLEWTYHNPYRAYLNQGMKLRLKPEISFGQKAYTDPNTGKWISSE
jgi:murein DD-endopeptidase MepM/ murein hydrolase activator NlpD